MINMIVLSTYYYQLQVYTFKHCNYKNNYVYFQNHIWSCMLMNAIVFSSVESQKGVIAAQRCSVENQKGAIAVQSLWQ